MKRTITDLEEKLIQEGYKLKSKEYGGKHSQKVVAYVYIKKDEVGDVTSIVLNQKRTKIVYYTINGIGCEELVRLHTKLCSIYCSLEEKNYEK